MSTLSTVLRSASRQSLRRMDGRLPTTQTRSAMNDAYRKRILAASNVLKDASPLQQGEASSSAASLDGLNAVNEGRFQHPYGLTVQGLIPKPTRRKPPVMGPNAKESRARDIFYQLDIDPLQECLNARLLSEFVTEMGKIKSRAQTGLTWRSQRRLTKAIKRAKMMGVIPILSRMKGL